MQVFLTGAVQVGKSTAIRTYLAGASLQPGGFTTAWRPSGTLELRLLETGEVFAVARRIPGRVIPDPAAFDAAGRRLADLGWGRALLVMDELGFLERQAPEFRRAVDSLLAAGAPVLGVLRDRPDNPFTPRIASNPGAVILTVTRENRDRIPADLAALFSGNP